MSRDRRLRMSVQLRRLTEDLNIIQTLADQPTLTATELKQKFDTAGNKIKDYINSLLLDDIEDAFGELEDAIEEAIQTIQEFIDNLTAEDISYDNTTSGMTATNVQDAIDELKGITNNLNSSIGSTNTNVGKKTIYSDFQILGAGATPTITPLQDYSGTITINKSGFFPIGIVGMNFLRTFADMQLLRWEMTSASSGRAVVTYRILNADNTRTLTPTVWANVLWVKER